MKTSGNAPDVKRHELNIAASSNPGRMLELLAQGADFDAAVNEVENPLQLLLESPHIDEDGRCVSEMMRHGAGRLLELHNSEGLAPLHIAAEKRDTGAVRALLAAGADVNFRCKAQRALEGGFIDGNTALHSAMVQCSRYGPRRPPAEETSLEIVRLLCDSGAEVNVRNTRGWTALTHAAHFCWHESIVRELCARGADVVYRGEKKLKSDSNVPPALSAALLWNTYEVAETLVLAGADCGQPDSNGETPLHYLARRPVKDSWNFYCEAIMMLRRGGADVNAVDRNGRTPLHHAAVNRHEAVRDFLRCGADPNIACSAGYTPVWEAVNWCKAESVRMLREAGASVNLCDLPDDRDRKSLRRTIRKNSEVNEALNAPIQKTGEMER